MSDGIGSVSGLDHQDCAAIVVWGFFFESSGEECRGLIRNEEILINT